MIMCDYVVLHLQLCVRYVVFHGAAMLWELPWEQQHVVSAITAAFGARSVGSVENMLSVLLTSAGLAKCFLFMHDLGKNRKHFFFGS